MKKLLFILFTLFFTFSFAQQIKVNNNPIKKSVLPNTITKVTASPNPFSSQTVVNFKSTKKQTVAFTVKNLLGKTVHSEKVVAKKGLNFILFVRNNISKGMYIYNLQSETEVVSKRLVIK